MNSDSSLDSRNDAHRTSPLEAAALRLSASDPAYVGYWLDRHCEHESLTTVELAGKLGLSAFHLAALSLSRMPAGETFAGELTVMCEQTGADAAVLGSLLRQEQLLAAWAAPRSTPAAPMPGWLLAAHDDDQPPPGPCDEDPPDASVRD